MYQYGRNYLLKIYDRDVGNLFTLQSSPTNEGLRVTFDIQKNVDNKSTANTAKVVVYNLSQATLSKLSDKYQYNTIRGIEKDLKSIESQLDNLIKEDENLINCIANGLTQVIVDNDIKDILNVKPKIDKHESWIGKKVNCWDDNKPDRPNVMEYVGFNAEDYMPYKCNNKGIIFLWKNIELVDDKNA